MAKDWEHYKNEFMLDYIVGMNHFIAWAEQGTPIEKIVALELVKLLQKYGTLAFDVKFQYQIDQYFVDFYIEYHALDKINRVIIECDGHDFHEKTKQQVSKDKQRERHLVTKGYPVLRYSGSDIVNNPKQIGKDLFNLFYPPIKETVNNGA